MTGRRSGSDWGFPTLPNGHDECKELSFITAINSPVPESVGQLKVGDILSVVVHQKNSKQFIALFFNNEIVGSIIENVQILHRCLSFGYSFQAEVIRKNGGNVEVSIASI